MATEAQFSRPGSLARLRTGALLPDWSAEAWAAVGITLAFISITCLWLAENHGIPVYDAANHLNLSIDAYEALSSGRLLKALTESTPYPPLVHLVGALGVFVGGIAVAPPIIAVNLIFVPLLALGCYNVGRLAFGRLAGLLSVVFVLGSPLIIEEFHELMLDAPEAAMVALALWALLASERFSRLSVCALAGAAVGLGMLSKETFAYFIVGPVLVTAVRGGPKAWRGIAIFAVVALAIALPWYLYELSSIRHLGQEAVAPSNAEASIIEPPRLSRVNLEWYFWSFLNRQLYVPLFAFTLIGSIWVLAGFVRRRPVSRFAVEIAFGAFISWVVLTETYVHDPRYSIPLMVYLAVLGAGWIAHLPRAARIAGAAVLVLVAIGNTLGVGFGVGKSEISGPFTITYQQPGAYTFYSTSGLWVGPPIETGNTLGLMRALRREGVRQVRWYLPSETETEYSIPGIIVLARIAGLKIAGDSLTPPTADRSVAFLQAAGAGPNAPPPCTKLANGKGIWVLLGGSREWGYCPSRQNG